MKSNPTLFSKSIKKSAVLIAIFGTALAFTSCKNDVYQPEEVSALSITNASPLKDSVDFFLNNRRVNNTAPLTFGKTLEYVRVFPGTTNGALTKPNTAKSFYSANFNLIKGQYQSLYVVTKGDSTSFLVLKDDFTAPATGQSKIRFVNLSSDSPAYDLTLDADTTVFTNRAYQAFSAFKNVKPTKYTATLVNTATKSVVATLSNIDITAGNFYTIYAKGLVNTTVTAKQVSLSASQHKW
ncbi:DUF4397 domain-containing protein [Pedobacter cryoconitis]|uniref:DUF4397 domain-containing protein n=1 Tax=Pedobacter cryoconitis TaxID=188932 RepID=A0A7X0J5Q8_9SPHI|nr:DUF4397 domain-containing protein [Pedobacter cryoconitis]MBB6501606.1 hypothetical protein [Pedobacter cryoconitis]